MTDLTASETAEQVRSGRLRATDVVEAALEAAVATHDDLNAFTLIDRSGALARAEGIDRLVASGRDPGPLAGVPIGLKDLIDQTGLPNSRGAGFPPVVPEHSATVVRRLGAAGAVIIGRTGLHEFAFGFTSENHFFGPVRNPWDLSTSPGGSSGGSGVAVAAGITQIGIGTDTGGSVRVPAALCGVFGLKVTHGRVPLTGVYPLAPSLDTVGPIATTVADISASYLVMAGYDPADGWSAPVDPIPPRRGKPEHMTIGVVRQWCESGPTSSKVRAGLEAFIAGAEAAGFEVREIDEPLFKPPERLGAAAGPEILSIHGQQFEEHPEGYGPLTRERLSLAGEATIGDVIEADAWSAMARNRIGALSRSGVDVLVCPTVGGLRKVIGEPDMNIDGETFFHRALLASFTSPMNRMGVPALAAPVAGFDGPPPSIQLIAPMWHEHIILEFAALLEAAGVLRSGHPPYAWTGGSRNGRDDASVQ
jgi:Asp-tRNA(Asn)/Glu-tRNA(Gln) amidotransferase A subunit family amidase